MAALGWFCLTGELPAPVAKRPSLTTLRPEVPARLAEVLTSCLSIDPAARPSARAAAVEAFDAAPAESVRLASVSDPAAEITRRIRAAAVSASTPATPSDRKRHRDLLVIGVVALLVAVALGSGATWFFRRPPVPVQPVPVQPVAVRPVARPAPPSLAPSSLTTPSPTTRPVSTAATIAAPTVAAPTVARPAATAPTVGLAKRPVSIRDVVTAPDSPRVAAAGLLQALVDSRALAYVARNSGLLDLVYAAGAPGADVDQGNIAAALKNGGTYLGLAFVVKDAAFLDGTSDTARIRATIVTPAYKTGQPDGRRVPHAQDIVGPSAFALRLTPDGWRIRGLTG
jgi:eukaryotic-like serine/threonine-protein kinase